MSRKWVDSLRVDVDRLGETIDFRQERSVDTTTLDDLMDSCDVPFIVETDIEGYEVNVLLGLKRPCPSYHSR